MDYKPIWLQINERMFLNRVSAPKTNLTDTTVERILIGSYFVCSTYKPSVSYRFLPEIRLGDISLMEQEIILLLFSARISRSVCTVQIDIDPEFKLPEPSPYESGTETGSWYKAHTNRAKHIRIFMNF